MQKKRAAPRPTDPRKQPRQKRAADTVAILIEAAARILERDGFEGFNTNAIAEKAGVSVGSLYQYFPGKNALLSALIAREAAPLLAVEQEIRDIETCRLALRAYLRASIRHQMRHPELARLLDIAERRDLFAEVVAGTTAQLQAVVETILRLPDAPRQRNRSVAAHDLLSITRALVDAAGERGEPASPQLLRRIEGALWGYLES